MTKCSKTWFFCKGTPQEIIKAAYGGVEGVKLKDILNIFQLLQQVANDQFIDDFTGMLDWPAQEPGQVTLFSPKSVHHAGMPKLQENTKQNKPAIKLICQFVLVSLSLYPYPKTSV